MNEEKIDIPTTFLKQPLVTKRDEVTSKVAYVGVGMNSSYDMNTAESGVIYAPDALRAISMRYSNIDDNYQPLKIFNIERGYLLDGVTIDDTGNITLKSDIRSNNDDISREIRKILSCKSLPLVIGGDHYITFPLVSAYETDLTVVQFDAHADFLNEEDCLHGSVMRFVSDLPHVKRVIHCGLRGNLNTGLGLVESINSGNRIVTARSLKEHGLDSLLKHIQEDEPIYITFDTDFLDPSVAPGTGCMEPNGVDYELAKQLLCLVAEKGKVKGIDFTEYNPKLDHNNITGVHLMNLIIETLSSIFSVNDDFHKKL